MDCWPPGSSVHGIFQARILKWVYTFLPRDQTRVSLSPALAGRFFTTSASWEAHRAKWTGSLSYMWARQPPSDCKYVCTLGHLQHVLLIFAGLLPLLLSRVSRVWLCATPWTAAYQAPPSMGFSRQEYWSGLPLPSPFAGLEIMKIVHWPSHFSH